MFRESGSQKQRICLEVEEHLFDSANAPRDGEVVYNVLHGQVRFVAGLARRVEHAGEAVGARDGSCVQVVAVVVELESLGLGEAGGELPESDSELHGEEGEEKEFGQRGRDVGWYVLLFKEEMVSGGCEVKVDCCP